jgi:16S rRNA (cytosine967-C5)-methyltransferase
VCTISEAESHDVIRAFLAGNPAFVLEDLGSEYPQWQDPRAEGCLQLLPHRDRTDGFFVARLRRASD